LFFKFCIHGEQFSSVGSKGSEPLSDVFVAVRVEEGLKKTRGLQVKAPEESRHLDVQQSTRVTSAILVPAKASTSGPTLIKAPPGVRPSVGYQYKVLPPVEDQGDKAPELQGEPEDLSGKAAGSRDSAVIQVGSKVLQMAKVG
jgi:hypothetical protein